jgi:glycosyltransferase involved in cell wall biosynthesis
MGFIPNGIAPPTMQRSRAEVREELRLSDQDFFALLVATLRPEKRADVFVRAVLEANAREPRIRGIVAGGGPGLADVQALAATSNGVVEAIGEIRSVGDVMGAADVVCLSSSAEGLPLVVLEAMSLERPILATAVGGLTDAVGPGHTGVLVPPADEQAFADALVALARDPAATALMGSAARQRFDERYTVEKMADAYAAMLRDAARPDGRHAG